MDSVAADAQRSSNRLGVTHQRATRETKGRSRVEYCEEKSKNQISLGGKQRVEAIGGKREKGRKMKL